MNAPADQNRPAGDGQDTAHGPGPGVTAGARIEALRERGAQGVDPVRLCFVEALARRSAGYCGEARRVLDAKLEQALRHLDEQVNQADTAPASACPPDAAPHGGSLLTDLVEQLDRQAARAQGVGHGELKAVTQSRSTWARLSVNRQLARSLAKVPENQGPLNSHLLTLRALRSMQDIAPEYLARFMSYANALLWLDQASFGGLPATGQTVRRDGERKRKPSRQKTV